jgi:hypothetical protein
LLEKHEEKFLVKAFFQQRINYEEIFSLTSKLVTIKFVTYFTIFFS